MLDSKQLQIIYWVILAFRDYYVSGECEETPMGMMQEGIDDYLLGFDIQGGRYRVADLKEALLCAYQSDIELWWRFNCYSFHAKPPLHEAQEEDEESLQRACVFSGLNILDWVRSFWTVKSLLSTGTSTTQKCLNCWSSAVSGMFYFRERACPVIQSLHQQIHRHLTTPAR
ncbi:MULTISPECIES: hypothetical protein [unclassified Pseudoalteromonas]|uniref:hypothetical protein n=1 Tax=unclassified Pseudoalteromonas TaxID=194690 RepID=UPI002097D672|nr:hypothetical protein [Pseudoalteromonas sp. XMcav2-N]MCO7190627.1 hypothetical protein [Pseudoalteromonas sp. XMcav2-N]